MRHKAFDMATEALFKQRSSEATKLIVLDFMLEQLGKSMHEVSVAHTPPAVLEAIAMTMRQGIELLPMVEKPVNPESDRVLYASIHRFESHKETSDLMLGAAAKVAESIERAATEGSIIAFTGVSKDEARRIAKVELEKRGHQGGGNHTGYL